MAAIIKVRGIDALAKTFSDLNDFDEWATPPMERATEALYNRVRTYPTQTATKTGYVRTFTLQRSIDWSVESSSNGVTGRVFSTGANQGKGYYEGFVKVEGQGKGFQADIHKGTWNTDVQDLTAEEENIMDEFSKAAADVLR
jgi:hypothetical protein